MMSSFNKVILLGNLTRNPELKYTTSGSAVCEFGIATNRKYNQNNEQKEEVCFIGIVVFGKSGEACNSYLQKGSQAMIEGRLKYEQWEDRDTGKKRSTVRVIADNVQFITTTENNQQRSQYGQHPNTQYQAPQQSNQSTGYASQGINNSYHPAQQNNYQTNNEQQDDIPF